MEGIKLQFIPTKNWKSENLEQANRFFSFTNLPL